MTDTRPRRGDGLGPFTVLITCPNSQTAYRLAGDGTLTRRRVHAAQIATREKAQRIAQQITDDPTNNYTARVERF